MISRLLLGCLAIAALCASSAPRAAAQPEGNANAVERIVSLAPHLTELTFTAAAGDRIVGTVEYSDYPAAARDIPRVGDAFRVDLERLLAIAPDVVLAWDTGTPIQIIERIRALGLRVEVFSTQQLHDVGVVLRRLGRMTGTSDIAEQRAARFEREIERLRHEYRERNLVSVFLQVNDSPLYTVNEQHIISEIAALCGARNVFSDLNELAPSIGIEAVIAANPQVIIALDEGTTDAQQQWQRWRHIKAVRAGNVFTLPADDLARPTTRLSSGALAVCRALDTGRENLGRSG